MRVMEFPDPILFIAPFKHGIVAACHSSIYFVDLRVNKRIRRNRIYHGTHMKIRVGLDRIVLTPPSVRRTPLQIGDEHGLDCSHEFPPPVYVTGKHILYVTNGELRDYDDVRNFYGSDKERESTQGSLVTTMKIVSCKNHKILFADGKWRTMQDGKLVEATPPEGEHTNQFRIQHDDDILTTRVNTFRTVRADGYELTVTLTGRDVVDRLATKLPPHILSQVTMFLGLTRNHIKYYDDHAKWAKVSHLTMRKDSLRKEITSLQRKRKTAVKNVDRALLKMENAKYHLKECISAVEELTGNIATNNEELSKL